MSAALQVLQSASDEVVETAIETIAQKFFAISEQLRVALGERDLLITANEVMKAQTAEQQKHIRLLEADIANATRDHQRAIVELEGGRCLSVAQILETGRYWDRCYGCRNPECRPTDTCYLRRLAHGIDGDDRD